MNIYHNKKVLKVEKVTKEYNHKNIIEDIDIYLNQGEFVTILGPSGCGKSTLFNVIAGLLKPEQGKVWVNENDVTGKTGIVSYMYQKDLLLPWRNVIDNGILPLEIKGMKKDQARQMVMDMLPIFELAEDGEKYPDQLSGGMKQRVSLLRTYMFSKEIMLLDEPFGGLDAITRLKMQTYLLDILKKIKGSVLFITHDIDEAIFLSDRIYVITGAPAHIVEELQIPRKQISSQEDILSGELSPLRNQILKLL
ncbi:ABC transporter ATP-binding protein [Acetobacterium woodii]|uniref:ABC transport system ATP-binding protein n=1 Tax=Acetobacterium woodii (strain ATCC 29683 / DSM 1030 / JCM 2381 / KCTC 1655 / WB1) TaxID=931626 RepID=H6LG29_ACEWD|nr:ABC transporter ATP-binding protein [Acetobacterium woodii]AFA49505.1 ABC transport system ATP-binding protein [Acetobacterium woodii DSM 1030]